MKQSVRLGLIGGITVGAHWSVAVIVAQVLAASVLPAAHPHERPAVYWTVGIVAAALYLGSLLTHERAHALVARRSGVTVRSVTLWMLGGVTDLEGEPPTAGADSGLPWPGPWRAWPPGGICYGLGAAVHGAGGPAVVVAATSWRWALPFCPGGSGTGYDLFVAGAHPVIVGGRPPGARLVSLTRPRHADGTTVAFGASRATAVVATLGCRIVNYCLPPRSAPSPTCA